MIPPRGFKAELYPLHHRLDYSVGLSGVTETMNSTILTLVKHYKSITDPITVMVNPHSPDFETDGGAICAPMSIIDKLKLTLRFNLTKQALSSDGIRAMKCSWMPIFFSFPEKLDAADDRSTTTVASLLSLTKDATEEDITPAFSTKTPVDGGSELVHPTSSVHFNEVFGTLNLTTNTGMEGVPFNMNTFFKALSYYTNKGALKACIGQTRHMTLTETRPVKTYHINKFVPKAIRRIVPYSFFGILLHIPVEADVDQHYYSATLTPSKAHIGIKAIARYHEWNTAFNQEESNV